MRESRVLSIAKLPFTTLYCRRTNRKAIVRRNQHHPRPCFLSCFCVSHHAVIVDTGTSYIINDLRSSNGVHVQHQRIRSAATLKDGDHIRICDHEFTFEIPRG